MYDVIIIGAGVNGCCIARELSKYQLEIAVLEKGPDVCEGTSKANSGICHAGHDAKNNTLKAKLNVRGSEMMESLSKELGFLYRRCGSLVVCFSKEDIVKLEELKERGIKNGVKGLEILTKEEVCAKEPNISSGIYGALWAPTGAIIDPFGLTVAMADNAAVNKVNFKFGNTVTDIKRTKDGYRVYVKAERIPGREFENKEYYDTKLVINAAGVFADTIHNMIAGEKIEILPRRGEYMLLDKSAGSFTNSTIFQLPTGLGKGILVTPTVHGNLLAGPTAEDIEDKEDISTTVAGYSNIKAKTELSLPGIPLNEVITSFSGLRARLVKTAEVVNFEEQPAQDDFLIGEVPDNPGFIDVAGMESPGLSCAPATAEYVARLVEKRIPLKAKEDFLASDSDNKRFASCSDAEKEVLIADNPLYGNVICRCETVTEAEIVQAIHSPIGAVTSDGIKRRVRAGMGRCQSGFCNPKVVEVLARELGTDITEVLKNQQGSEFISDMVRG